MRMGGNMIEKAYAKINLTLEIVGKKEGYHLLESVVIPIDLHDTLTFSLSHQDEVISNVSIKDNNILKAIHLFKQTYQIDQCVKVILDKQIPIGAGLGGSSADISATLRGLNRLFKLNKPLKELEGLANQLGSDTLFCLYNKRSFIYGRGDYIHFYENNDKLDILLILPNISLLTKDVFHSYGLLKEKHNYIGFESYLKKGDMAFIVDHSKNDLLKAALALSQPFHTLYHQLIASNLKVHMSGSGPALFMINPTKEEINSVKSLNENTLLLFSKAL